MTEATGLLDPTALAIVLVGTILATLAREGWQDVRIAITAAAKLSQNGFDATATRSALARTVGAINRLGHLGAEPVDPPDEATTGLLNAYIRSGSIDAMMKLARTQRIERDIQSVAATRVYETASELAPVPETEITSPAAAQTVEQPTAPEPAAATPERPRSP